MLRPNRKAAVERQKADITEIYSRVKVHDEGKCSCRPSDQAIAGPIACSGLLKGFNLEPLDWLILLFGASTPFVLRPDCRKRMLGNSNSVSYCERVRPFDLNEHDRPSGTFVLVEPLDDFRPGDKGRWHPITRKLPQLAGIQLAGREMRSRKSWSSHVAAKEVEKLSCVFADLEIR